MRRVLSLLIVLAVLLGGLHLDASAQAHEEATQHEIACDSGQPADSDPDPHPGTDKVVHGHHHCPLAPDEGRGPALRAMTLLSAALFARAVPALPSLAQAPPIQPPTA